MVSLFYRTGQYINGRESNIKHLSVLGFFFLDGFAVVNCYTLFLCAGKGVPEELCTADS